MFEINNKYKNDDSMMFEFKNIVKNGNYKIIDITSSSSGLTTLKKYYEDINSDYCIYSLSLILSLGDIKNHLFDRDILFNDYSDSIKELLSDIKNDTIIRIYSSKMSSEDYLLLLYICNLLKDYNNEIQVVFTSDYDNAFTLGALDYREIPKALENMISLSKEDVINYSNTWDDLINTNSELRVLKDTTILNKNYSDYDELIISELNKIKPCKISKLVGNLLGNFAVSSTEVSVYYYLVDRLISNGKITKDDEIIK